MSQINPVKFLTIYCAFEDTEAVEQCLPSILTESSRTDSAVIVHDSSEKNRAPMANLIRGFKNEHDFFFLQSDAISMGHARNLCFNIAMELYVPQYICMVEDDHGFKPGMILSTLDAMNSYYGTTAPNNLRYGIFTACPYCWGEAYRRNLKPTVDGHYYVDVAGLGASRAGGCNSCFRCAPTSHWISVLKGYDNDEYPISPFQTNGLNLRNYHKGFTTLVVAQGNMVSRYHRDGRGFTTEEQNRPFHDEYALRDLRSGEWATDPIAPAESAPDSVSKMLIGRPLSVLDIGARGGPQGVFPGFMDRQRFDRIMKHDLEFIGIEPHRENAAQLARLYRQMFDIALGGETGEATLFVTKSPDKASLLRPNYEIICKHYSGDCSEFEVIQEVHVSVKTLDALFDKFEVVPDWIKVDVQGLEHEILEGGILAVNQASLIVLEQSSVQLYENQKLCSETDRFLQSMGFTKVAQNFKEAMPVEFDAVYLRNLDQVSTTQQAASLLIAAWVFSLDQVIQEIIDGPVQKFFGLNRASSAQAMLAQRAKNTT